MLNSSEYEMSRVRIRYDPRLPHPKQFTLDSKTWYSQWTTKVFQMLLTYKDREENIEPLPHLALLHIELRTLTVLISW